MLAGRQVAAGRAMEELSDIILVDDHVVPVSMPAFYLGREMVIRGRGRTRGQER